MKKFAILWVFILTACGSLNTTPASMPANTPEAPQQIPFSENDALVNQTENVPGLYSDKTAPQANPETQSLGRALYQQHCAACHGASGLAESVTGANMTPPAPPLALVSNMHTDGYLFWRISEGGLEFGTAMPGWKNTLGEKEIWATIAYLREMGNSQSPEVSAIRASQQANSVDDAVKDGIVTEEEAKTFIWMRDTIERYLKNSSGSVVDEEKNGALLTLLQQGIFTSPQVEQFLNIQDRLRKNGYLQ